MPAASPPQMTVRTCAEAVIAAQRRHGPEPAAFLAAIERPIAALLERDDLRGQGIPRQGNNVDWSRYLYFDGDLSFLLFEVPEGGRIPPHDHGVWELFAVYRGRMRHTVYRRTDDASVEGYATLEATDDRAMGAGESAIVAPPADIHGFAALDGGAMGLTVVSGRYKPDRHYYDPEANSYVIKRAANLR